MERQNFNLLWLFTDFANAVSIVTFDGYASYSNGVVKVKASIRVEYQILILYRYTSGPFFVVECSHDAFLNCEGSGLYLTQSAANHSCLPNAEISFPYNNSTLRFTATKDLPADSVSTHHQLSVYC